METQTALVQALIKALSDGSALSPWVGLTDIKFRLSTAGFATEKDALRGWLDQLVDAGKLEVGTYNSLPQWRIVQPLPAPQQVREAIQAINQPRFNLRDVRKRSGLGLLDTKKALDFLEQVGEVARLPGGFDYQIAPPPAPAPTAIPQMGNPLDDYFGDGRAFSDLDAAIAAGVHPRMVKRALVRAQRDGRVKRLITGQYQVTQITTQAVKDLGAARQKYFKAQGGSDPDTTVRDALLCALNDVQFAGLLVTGSTGAHDTLALLYGIKHACDDLIACLTPAEHAAA